MKSYRLEFRASAEKELRRVDKSNRLRVALAIRALSLNPRPYGVTKLSGDANLYRIRIGTYRVIYEIDEGAIIVLIIRVAHRREVYR